MAVSSVLSSSSAQNEKRNSRVRPRGQVREMIVTVRAVGDAAIAFGALAFAFFLRFDLLRPFLSLPEIEHQFQSYVIYCLLGAGIYSVVVSNLGAYDSRDEGSRREAIELILRASMIWFFTFLGVTLFAQIEPRISRVFALFALGTMVVAQLGWRLLLGQAMRLVNIDRRLLNRVLVVGLGDSARTMARRLKSPVETHSNFLGYVAIDETDDASGLGEPVLGTIDQLEALCDEHQPDQILVADSNLSRKQVLGIARTCERRFVSFFLGATAFEIFTSCLQLRQLAGVPVLGVVDLPANRVFNRIAKRAMDIAGATVGLLASAPIIAVLAVLIKRESRGPIFYRQIRVGQGGRHFQIAKLRSMRADAEASGGARWAVADDPRRTRVGEFMRRTNLDELPQFWNVLIGDMSLVGPRPERPELIPKFLDDIPYYQSRHSVKPGITGWAQVNGLRGNTSLDERIRYDLHYIENWSLWWDLLIQIQTFYKVRNAY